MVTNATFNNQSVLLVEETAVLGENHRSATSPWEEYWIICFIKYVLSTAAEISLKCRVEYILVISKLTSN